MGPVDTFVLRLAADGQQARDLGTGLLYAVRLLP